MGSSNLDHKGKEYEAAPTEVEFFTCFEVFSTVFTCVQLFFLEIS